MNRTIRGVLLVSIILSLFIAGCSASPFDQPRSQQGSTPVVLVNNATLTETFTVAVVDVGATITGRIDSSGPFELTVDQGSFSARSTGAGNFTVVKLPETSKREGKYTLRPGERKNITVDGVSPDEAVVILVYDNEEETYRAIHTVSCGGPILGVRITSSSIEDEWTIAGHECG